MAKYKIGRDTYHYMWSREHEPAIKIKPGDTVLFEINDVSSWQITKKTKSEELKNLETSKLYPLSGPVYVEGAEPGDTLLVDVLNVDVDDFGWTAIIPGLGLLEEFNKPYLYKWDLSNKKYAPFVNGIKVPLRPFCGVLGVAPKEKGKFEVMPPGKHGGNMDIKHLVAGSKLRLPVLVEGALFSAGDVHAAMGDGEVCVCAIECAGRATLRFDIEKGNAPRWPQYHTKVENVARRLFTATGISSDLMEAAKEAVRNMITYLRKKYKLTKEQAYVLCSVAADMKVHEVVDRPNWVVGVSIAEDIFPGN